MLNALLSAILVVLIKLVYKKTNITPFEIIYAKCAISALVLFVIILSKGIYIFDIEVNLRSKVVLRGMLIFLGLVLFYESMQYIPSLSYNLIFQFAGLGVTHFFFIKKDKKGLWDTLSFGLCIISIILIPIETFEK